MKIKEYCDYCKGSGVNHPDLGMPCGACGGAGFVYVKLIQQPVQTLAYSPQGLGIGQWPNG